MRILCTVGRLRLALFQQMQKIHQAAQSGNLKLLQVYASRGLRLNAPNEEKWNALHFAVIGGHSDIVRFLIDKNISVNTCTSDKVSPLHLAAQIGDEFITTLLVENGAILDAKDANGRTPLHYAVSNNSKACVKFLLEFEASPTELDNEGCSPLHMAVTTGNIEIATLLLAGGCKPDLCYEKKGVSVHQPTIYWSPLHIAAEREDLDMMELLLSWAADPNVVNNIQVSPLHIAAEKQSVDMIDLLVRSGADVMGVDKDKETPLFLAVKKRLIENVRRLATDSTISMANAKDETVLHIACILGYGDIVEFFMNEFPENQNIFCIDKSGNTPLHYAVMHKHKECVKVLLEHGADIMARNNENQSSYALSTGEITTMMKKYMERNREVIRAQPMDKAPRSTKATPSRLKNQLSPSRQMVEQSGSPQGRLGQRPSRRESDAASVKSTTKKAKKPEEVPVTFQWLKDTVSQEMEELEKTFDEQVDIVRKMIEDLRSDLVSE